MEWEAAKRATKAATSFVDMFPKLVDKVHLLVDKVSELQLAVYPFRAVTGFGTLRALGRKAGLCAFLTGIDSWASKGGLHVEWKSEDGCSSPIARL